ncbi:TonB-dependent receptor [Methylocaldum marinum]|uniref:TonB-dependent receptor n=1 Tax=Methylocaldum marinum TaxID=1432792 RepID=A0A250KMQ8_9GAMM|nr:TonB-dependent receptor plug domain-containing protein [Methylocaldum marinum]BBA32854.1 TonB-dependent receptor [Methylocaldum marinum]
MKECWLARPDPVPCRDVPQSASVVSGQELARELSLDLGSITRRASNVQFNQNNTRGASLSIRGLGKRSFTETQDPSVGVTVDGVPYALTQLANFSFYDVDSVEVTRGPRGTEGGLAASSGKVNVISKMPTFSPTAELSAAYGQREAIILQGALGGSVIRDFLAWRGSFLVDKGRGFYTQEYDDNYSLYNRDRLSGRAQLLFTPTSNLTARFTADFEPRQPQLQNGLTFYHDVPFRFADGSLVDPNGTQAKAKLFGFTNNAGVFTGPRPYFQNRGFTWEDYIGGEKRQSVWFNENKGQTVSNQGGSFQVDWDIGEHLLSSITGVREYSFDAHNDEGTPFDISVDGGGGVFYRQWTQELKVRNKPGGFIDYTAGVIGLKTKDDIIGKTGWGADAGAWFATNAQYNTLDRNAGADRGSGLALLKDVLQDARVKETTRVETESGALFGESALHFTDEFTLTAGLRLTLEDRTTSNRRVLTKNGAGGALNPVAIRDVPLGGFDSAANGNLNPGNSVEQLNLADQVANRYFGKSLAGAPGETYDTLTAEQKRLVGTAKTLRAQQIGRLNEKVKGDYDDLLITAQLTPSYRFNEDLTGYFSWQYGEKSGSVIAVNGLPQRVEPENTHALELGLKSFWLDKSVIFNIDAFVMDIHNYQQSVLVVDDFQTAINIANGQANPTVYVAAQGNVKKVRAHGIEFDGVINTIPNLSIRLNGAYNVAKYIDYKNAAKPEELAYLPQPYIDQGGKLLPGASKWQFAVGAEYALPVFDNFMWHTSFNTTFQSKFNNTDNLSAYGWLDDRARTDAAIGIGTRDRVWDLSLIGKNIFNDRRHEIGWNSYSPDPYPRWFGIQLSGKL